VKLSLNFTATMFSSATDAGSPTQMKGNVKLVDIFKPNVGCTDLMYTVSGDTSLDIPLHSITSSTPHHHKDVTDLNRTLHSTINHNEDIIPPHTLLPSVTNLFRNKLHRYRYQSTQARHAPEYDPAIDGMNVPTFDKPTAVNPFEYCLVRAILSTAMGAVGGAFFALFINAFQNPIPWELQDKLSTKEQLVYSYKDLVRNMKRLGKQMAIIGGLYGGIECFIERNRARQDIHNHLYTGCITGGVLGSSGGPYAAMMGCGGFAAFSLVIEMVMDSEHTPEQRDDENTKQRQYMMHEDLLWM